jgi:SAM-dependent methyltransferase
MLYKYAPKSMLRWASSDNKALAYAMMGHMLKGPVLEIGCGKGFLLSHLAENGFTPLYGLDISPGNLTLAQKRLENKQGVTLIQARAELYDYTKLPKLTTIIMKNFWGFLSEEESLQLLQHLRQALADNGQIIIGPYTNLNRDAKLQEAYDLLYDRLGFILDYNITYNFENYGFSVKNEKLDDIDFYFLQLP